MTPDNNVFDQSSVLLSVIEDLSHPNFNVENVERRNTNPAGNYSENMHQMEKLQKECEDLR